MGIVAIKIKVMPKSPQTDLRKIEREIRKELQKNNVKDLQFEIQPVAFGLKTLIVLFGWPEEKEFETFEKDLKKINDVSSIDIMDMRRAIG